MTTPLLPIPMPPRQLPDADLWEYYRARGLTPEAATLHVERRRSAKAGQARSIAEGPFGTGPLNTTPTKGQAFLRNATQGITSGFGDEIIAAMNAMSERQPGGPVFDPAIYNTSKEDLRQQVATARVEHPIVSVAGSVGGALANPLNKLLGPLTAGLGPTAAGATSGTVLGGLQGFGEGTGTPRERLPSAAVGAVAGGLTGAALGKVIRTFWPSVRVMGKNIRAAFGKTAPRADLMAMTEAAVRKELAGQPPEVVEALLDRLRAVGQVAPKPPPPPPPPTLRPGETITPIGPKGFEVTGPRATPPVPTTPTILEMQQGRTRGVGGHSYTGTYPAGTAANVPGRAVPSPQNPGAQAMQLQQLQMLAQMPEAEFQSVAGLFPQEIIQQLQAIRAQFGLGR